MTPRTHRGPGEYDDVKLQFERIGSIQDDDPKTAVIREEIITRCLPIAENIARRFDGRGEAHDDLVQVARIGLVNAVNRFDVGRGSDFLSFAVPTIMGEVRRHFRDTAWALRVPRRVKELHLSIGKAIDQLSQRLGRAPTPAEIAAELGLDRDEVADGLMARNAYQTVSVDAATHDNPGEQTLADTIGDYDHEMENVDNHEVLRPLIEALPPRERRVLMLRFFGNMTQTQIAEEVGISQMHVSRLLARTLAELRDQLGE
ncbi:SigB/SigF/SigG family RNA polymerase sigma factor [Antrihabitans cavernicola]|uniref:SigB/SigF/SigG family RNA polymerase sigma factor n=1 Tax=Antrihabitans cavernicola TaxID=2495913 RepID=A0A5A7S857_9NOCA|nr:SigB/SigF/SigG family RNA polymerase sigma factor [Spelaeibacter cavernicola]KAA0019462.1 SigB/SigF/SigG family RNA polymerase sigma factor [Spelaeibacter cavernicola]